MEGAATRRITRGRARFACGDCTKLRLGLANSRARIPASHPNRSGLRYCAPLVCRVLGFQGRFDEAFTESERARKLDPLSLIVSADYAALLYFSRQYDRSIEEFRGVLEMEPNFPRAYIVIFPLVEKGLYDEALADVDKWNQVVDSPWPLAVKVYVYARSGQMAQARRSLQKLQHMDQRRFLDPAAMLMAHVGWTTKKRLSPGCKSATSTLSSHYP